MKRLLCIVSAMNTGGAETFLMKIYRCIDKKKYQMDFCVNSDKNFYSSEIESFGGHIYIVPIKSKHPIMSFIEIRNVVKENKYDYVIRVNEHSLSTLDLIAAKSGGAKHLIMRSSNASSGSRFSILLHKIFKFLPIMIPEVKIAPSELAAEYTFGKKATRQSKVLLLPNGLDVNIYAFSYSKREKYRELFGIEGRIVFGHVGRFSHQKNHSFLIDIFSELKKTCPEAVLLLIGDGELKRDIQEKVKKLNLNDDVLFAGIREDVNEILSAMDLFVFPSFYEGMPNTVIEAQTCGLPCVISNTITAEVKVTDLVMSESLSLDAKYWAQKCIEYYERFSDVNRCIYSKKMIECGYAIEDCANKFVKYIFEGEKC